MHLGRSIVSTSDGEFDRLLSQGSLPEDLGLFWREGVAGEDPETPPGESTVREVDRLGCNVKLNLGSFASISTGKMENTEAGGSELEVLSVARREMGPEVRRFSDLVQGDPRLLKTLEMMLEEGFRNQGTRVKTPQDFFEQMDGITTRAPEFHTKHIYTIPLFYFLSGFLKTSQALAFFGDREVDGCIKGVIRAWCCYLSDERQDSRSVLTGDKYGWLGSIADELMRLDDYQFDRARDFGGFKTFNDFFTRQLKPGARPVDPNPDAVVSVCDCTIHHAYSLLRSSCDFDIKNHRYSLGELFGGREHSRGFVGGKVIQGFLTPYDYHRWHAPVDGTVVDCYLVDGYSYAVNRHNSNYEETLSFLSHVNSRGVVVIESTSPAIGKVAVINVGMGEVSSCVLTVQKGAQLKRGDELGYFQFGGSTFCVLFEKKAALDFAIHKGDVLRVGQTIAVARPARLASPARRRPAVGAPKRRARPGGRPHDLIKRIRKTK